MRQFWPCLHLQRTRESRSPGARNLSGSVSGLSSFPLFIPGLADIEIARRKDATALVHVLPVMFVTFPNFRFRWHVCLPLRRAGNPPPEAEDQPSLGRPLPWVPDPANEVRPLARPAEKARVEARAEDWIFLEAPTGIGLAAIVKTAIIQRAEETADILAGDGFWAVQHEGSSNEKDAGCSPAETLRARRRSRPTRPGTHNGALQSAEALPAPASTRRGGG